MPNPISDETTPARWYALRVKPQHERAVARALQDRGIEEFVPLYRSRRVWSDRIRELDLPLFPGYVLCRFSLENRIAVLRVPGVTSLIGFGGQPAPLDETEIANVRIAVGSGMPLYRWPFLKAGDTVRIEHGPLRGMQGTLLAFKDSWRIVVGITLLQRSVAVELEPALVTSIGRGPDLRQGVC